MIIYFFKSLFLLNIRNLRKILQTFIGNENYLKNVKKLLSSEQATIQINSIPSVSIVTLISVMGILQTVSIKLSLKHLYKSFAL